MNSNRLIDSFVNLIKINSESGFEKKIINYLYKNIKDLGFNSLKDSYGNLIVNIDGIGEPLFLGAHTDTVKPGNSIKPQVERGFIRSDGKTILGADNKVAVAVLVELLQDISKKKIETRPLDIVFTRFEETGNLGAINLNYSKIRAKKGYIFDSFGSIGTIVLGSPFYNRIEIKIVGKSAHASMPEKGINALQILAKAVNSIKLGKVNPKTIANIGTIEGGTVVNAVPGEIMIKGEVRSFIEKDMEDYCKYIIGKFRTYAEKMGGDIKADIIRENPGYEYLLTDKFVESTINKINKFGCKTSFSSPWACSDANIFNNNGMQVINLGDGVVNAHTVDEYISIDDLSKLGKLVLYLATN